MANPADVTSDESLDLARVLSESAWAIASQLEQDRAPSSDQRLHQISLKALEHAIETFDGVHVRSDRPPGSGRRGDRGWAWRFNLVLERPDKVLAVIEVLSGASDLERQAFASARLGLGVARGVAERAFLIALSPEGDGLISHSPPARAHPELPAVISVAFGQDTAPWVLAITEATAIDVGAADRPS